MREMRASRAQGAGRAVETRGTMRTEHGKIGVGTRTVDGALVGCLGSAGWWAGGWVVGGEGVGGSVGDGAAVGRRRR